MNNTTERQSSQSSDKLLQILECIAQNRLPIRLQDLAEQVNMSQSTVLRYLYALQSANYVYQEEDTSRYALTWRVCRLSENVNSYPSLRNITTPFIQKLSGTFNVGVCLVVEQNYECLYLDCIDTAATMSSTLQRIGKRAPLHATSSGKVLLSQYSEPQLENYIQTTGLPKLTEYTISDPEVLRQELETVRQRGYGSEKEECEIGLHCISSPLRDYSGKIIASISIFGSKLILTDAHIHQTLYPALSKATRTISSRLGYIENT